MNKNGIAQKLKVYVINATFSDLKEIKDDLLIFKEGILDSMGLVSLISFLEEEFNIKVSDKDLVEENFESINAITEFITTLLN